MIKKGKEARETILKGIEEAGTVVASTLGAKGRTVMLMDKYGLGFKVTKDGVSIAEHIKLEDDFEDTGATIIKSAARKTVEEAGDGTTTTSILTMGLCKRLNEAIEKGENLRNLSAQLEDDMQKVVGYIKSVSKKIDTTDQIRQIATISANNDHTIGNLIKEVYDSIGHSGVVSVVEDDSSETVFEVTNGYTLPNTGYTHTAFINNPEKGVVEYYNPRVFILDNTLGDLRHNIKLVQELDKQTDISDPDFSPLVIIVHNIEEVAQRQILDALSEGNIKDTAIVVSNLIYQNRHNRLTDVAHVINAEYSNSELKGHGTCEKIIIGKDYTTFINGAGDTTNYLKKLKKEKQSTEDFKSRIFDLELKAAVIKVGGKIQSEIGEKKDRIEDAICAVKSAIEEGYCAGGGSTYLFASEIVSSDIMAETLKDCHNQLLSYTAQDKKKITEEVYNKDYECGYDVVEDKVVNLLDKGIIDSAKVLRVAIENATRSALLFMNIDSIVG